MSIFKTTQSPQAAPAASTPADPIEPNIQVANAATAEKDRVAEAGEDDEKKPEPKKPSAELGNYFVSLISPPLERLS